MTMKSFSKMALCHHDCKDAFGMTGVTTTNITAAVSGFPASNLEYVDPWTMFKTNGITGDPIIQHEFTNAASATAIAIMNHNLGYDEDGDGTPKYSSIDIEVWDSTAWFPLGTQILDGNKDILAAWNAYVPDELYRITITPITPSVWPDFFIGSIVYFRLTKEFDVNPEPAAFLQTVSSSVISDKSSGGATHTTFGSNTNSSEVEISFARGSFSDLRQWQTIRKNKLVGIMAPENADHSGGSLAWGQEHFLGYFVDRVMGAVGPGTSQASGSQPTYEYSVYLRGAV